jgi:hypothetical protein
MGKFKVADDISEYLLAGLIVLVSLASFGLGRLSLETGRGTPLSEIASSTASVRSGVGKAVETASVATTTTPEGGYVASKNGTKYHLPWCAGAKQISVQNKIFFTTKGEAEAAGYTPAANCKGI